MILSPVVRITEGRPAANQTFTTGHILKFSKGEYKKQPRPFLRKGGVFYLDKASRLDSVSSRGR